MIVVTAPTGKIGHRVLAHVLAAGAPTRVVVRDPARLPADVRERAEIVTGSHGDPTVVDEAFAGADTVFWLLPGDRTAATAEDAYVGFTRPAAQAIRTHGVRRVVTVSSLGRGTAYEGRAGNITASLAMDDLIASTGVDFRALAMPGFMDNMLRQVGPIAQQGLFFDITAPDLKVPVVATRDIAAVAARLLLDDSWTGQAEVPVLGPEDLSNDDLAVTMSDVLGRTVRYQRIPARSLHERMVASGASEGMAQAMVDMLTARDNGLLFGVTRTPRHAVDTPTTFRQWCEETLKPAVG